MTSWTETAGGAPRPIGGVGMVLWQSALGIAILFAWQGVSGRLVDNFFISNPIDVGRRLLGWTLDGSIFVHLWATLVCDEHRVYYRVGTRRCPRHLARRVAFRQPAAESLSLCAQRIAESGAGAAVRICGSGWASNSKIALAAALVLFLVFLNTFAGVRQVDQDLIDTARLMKATRIQIISKVIMPSALSWLFVGLRVSVPYALIGAVIGEMIASNRGLGYLVQFSGAQFDTAGVFAVLIVIALLAMVLNFAVDIVERRLERWRIVSR